MFIPVLSAVCGVEECTSCNTTGVCLECDINYRLENNICVRKYYVYMYSLRQGPVRLLRYDAVARRLINGSAAFIESWDSIGWMDCDSIRSL